MTSMPASRRARAMIFAPRSWPSRPGLATTTRIFLEVAMRRGILWPVRALEVDLQRVHLRQPFVEPWVSGPEAAHARRLVAREEVEGVAQVTVARARQAARHREQRAAD